MNSYVLASPVVIGLVAAFMLWDSTAMLNRATQSSLKGKDLLGEVQPDQAYGHSDRQRADVYLPPDTLVRPSRGWPLVVFFYGGSWTSGHKDEYAFVGRSMAARGMVVVVADYRLYPEVRYPGFVQDSAAAVAWAYQRAPAWQADPQRVFVMGHSAGAYNAAMVALDERWLAPHGLKPQQLAGFIGMAGPYNFLPVRYDNIKPIFHFPDTPLDSQPVAHASAAAPRTWLFTAAADSYVSPTINTDALFASLQKAGARVEKREMFRTSHITLVASMATPLNWLSPVLDDVSEIVLVPQPQPDPQRLTQK